MPSSQALPRSIAALVSLCSILLGGSAIAQEHPGFSEEEIRQMKERSKGATALTEHHAALASLLGDWDVEIVLVMPGVPSQTSRATARFEWLIEGRWLGEKLQGNLFGAPYESFAIRGFDTYAKNHVVAVVQSMDNALLVGRGVVVDPTGKNNVVYGTLDEYTTGEIGKGFKAVSRRIDDDHHTLEVWDLGIGVDGAKVFEYRYTRKK